MFRNGQHVLMDGEGYVLWISVNIIFNINEIKNYVRSFFVNSFKNLKIRYKIFQNKYFDLLSLITLLQLHTVFF